MGIHVTVINKGINRAVAKNNRPETNIRVGIGTATGSGSGGVSRLQDLSDVDTTGQADGEPLVYDQANNKYEFRQVNGGVF